MGYERKHQFEQKIQIVKTNMKKQIANIITSLRIIGSIALLFFSVFSFSFCTIYLFCGFSDMIDGTIARKTNTVSELGSKLDTAADFVFVAVCLIKLLPLVNIPVWLWIWIAVIAIIKAANIAWGFVLRKKLVALHTALNKFTGLLLFLLPLMLHFIESTYILAAICAVATVAAVQEGYYIATDAA